MEQASVTCVLQSPDLWCFLTHPLLVLLLQNPWGVAPAAPAAPACSLADVMSEQLARQLEEEEGSFSTLAQ